MNKNFHYATYITWNHDMQLDTEFQNLTRNRLDYLISQGKTNGIKSFPVMVIHDGNMTYRRVWADNASAQEWIDFVKNIDGYQDGSIFYEPE